MKKYKKYENFYFCKISLNLHKIWGLGIGDWGLGIGPIPNPQSPIPNPLNNKKITIFNITKKIIILYYYYIKV
jgi:hypothetical protein